MEEDWKLEVFEGVPGEILVEKIEKMKFWEVKKKKNENEERNL